MKNYPHFGFVIYKSLWYFDKSQIATGYDSIRVMYDNDLLQHFYGYNEKNYTHLLVKYYETNIVSSYHNERYMRRRGRPTMMRELLPKIKVLGQYNLAGQKMGTWKYFDENRVIYKTENYLIPRKEEELAVLNK